MAKVNSGEGKGDVPWFHLNPPNLRKFAPRSIPALSEHFETDFSNIKNFPTVPIRVVSNEKLEAITQAYREANGLLVGEGDTEG